MDPLVTVETDLFEHREVKPHFINPCCFGEDFAAWLRTQLLSLEQLGFKLSEPIQEDYGWGFWASHDKDAFWVAISFVGDGPQETIPRWVISVNYDAGLNVIKRFFHRPDQRKLQQLRDSVLQTISSRPAIKIVANPSYGP